MYDFINTDNHPSSRKIRIRRAGSFLSRAQGKDVDDYFQNASLSIGSYFESSAANRIASGMTPNEERIVMPHLLGILANDREYLKMRNDYFAGVEVKVPHKEGVEFEIGLNDNDKPLADDNLPLDLHSYVRFRCVSKHPWVAKNQEEADGNQLKKFFIHDEVKATQNQANVNDAKDDALAYYLQLKSNPEKVNMLLVLLGIDYRNIEGTTEDQAKQKRQERLRKLVEDSPIEVVKIRNDRDLEVKYKVQMLLNTGILRKIGAKYLIAETGDSLGTIDEAIQFFKDEEENSDKIAILTAKMQEAVKGGKKTKRTVAK